MQREFTAYAVFHHFPSVLECYMSARVFLSMLRNTPLSTLNLFLNFSNIYFLSYNPITILCVLSFALKVKEVHFHCYS